ncbi:MAG: hypothetical protein Q8Q89_00895 [bacterium]|nr:hypothetical protein [bacterium]
MSKKNNNGTTLNDLANMVAKGFENTVNKQEFNDLRLEVKDMNKRLGRVEYQVDEVYDILKRFEENDILNLQKRVQILEKAVRALATNQTSR